MITSCSKQKKKNNHTNHISVIPQPVSITQQQGFFEITSKTKIVFDSKVSGMDLNAGFLIKYFKNQYAIKLSIVNRSNAFGNIHLLLDDSIVDEEGYELLIDSDQIKLSAKTSVGIFYGIQTLMQLLQENKPRLPKLQILDYPRFEYRGMMLDVSRHFFSTTFIKKYIDILAHYKLNYFHWHLTDDQGWRIEIKKYPKLTEIGSSRSETIIGGAWERPQKFDGEVHQGFYSQEDIKEIVAYAKARHVTVIPEIEFPGHSLAVLASYPELSCTGGPFEVSTKWEIYDDVFCIGNEKTFEFIEGILSEVIQLFPDPYIHIGGDETPKTKWESCTKCQARINKEHLTDEQGLQSYAISWIERFISSKGKRMIGWDEILQGGLAANATVMSWRDTEGGIKAAKLNHNVIMTPNKSCYFDHYQFRSKDEPLAWGGYTTLKHVYEFEPIPSLLSSVEQEYIIGAQACLWTEYISTEKHAEYMTFPRLYALAEVVWSPKESKNWQSFVSRVPRQFRTLDERDINYANYFFDVSGQTKALPNGGLEIVLKQNDKTNFNIHYTLDGTTPTSKSTRYQDTIILQENTVFKSATVNIKDGKVGRVFELNYNRHLAVGQQITVSGDVSERYPPMHGVRTLIDGIKGGDNYDDTSWYGTEEDLEVIIEFNKPTTITKVGVGFVALEPEWLYAPTSIEIYEPQNGIEILLGKIDTIDSDDSSMKIELTNPGEVMKLKIIIKNYGIIPEGKDGAGHKAWMFLDEIEVN